MSLQDCARLVASDCLAAAMNQRLVLLNQDGARGRPTALAMSLLRALEALAQKVSLPLN